MSFEEENLRRLIEIVHDPREFTICLQNKPYAVSSDDNERGLVLLDLRVDSQRQVYMALMDYISGQRNIKGERKNE